MFFSGALDNLKIHDGELIVRDVFFGYHMDLEYNAPVSYIHTYYHYRFGVNVLVCAKLTVFSSGHRIQVSLSYTSSEFMLNLFIFLFTVSCHILGLRRLVISLIRSSQDLDRGRN